MSLYTASSRLVAQRLRLVTLHSGASIATATLPLLKPRKGRKKGVKKPPHKTRREQIDELKKQLEAKDEEVPLPPVEGKTPTIPSGPPPSMTREEFLIEFDKLWNTVLSEANPAMSKEAKIQLNMDMNRIQQGGLSLNEMKGEIKKSLESRDIDPIDRKRVKDALHPRRTESFLQYTLTELINPGTLAVVNEVISKPPLEDFSPLANRIEELWLDAIPPYMKREYFASKAKLYFSKYPLYWSWGSGKSMLPTLPEHGDITVGFPITEENVHEISVGHIVAYVVARDEQQPKFVEKRIQALAGDIVEFQGKRMIVPQGHFWGVGDNEPESFDSRHYGAVPMTNLRRTSHFSFSFTPPFVKPLSLSYMPNKADK